MSKLIICPVCGGMNIQTERRPDGDRHCLDCGSRWKIGSEQISKKQTVFDTITASYEVLAGEFVEPYTRWGEDGYLETFWRTNFRELSGMLFDTRDEAIAATVARLKEVADAEN